MEKINKNIYDMSLDVLNFKVSIFNCLMRANIKNVGDLLEYYVQNNGDFSKIRNLGVKGQEEVKRSVQVLLKSYNYDIDTIVEKLKLDLINTKNQFNYLNTSLYSLGINPSKFFDIYFHIKTLGDLLYTLSDIEKLQKAKNKDELKELIDGLSHPNIYFGMSKYEIDNLYVSDKALSDLKIEKDDQVEKLSSEVELKKQAYQELKSLVKEKEELLALSDELDNKIDNLLKRINYGKSKSNR